MKLEEKDIKKLEHVMSKHRIASVDELIAVIERGQRFGKHAGGRPRTITNEKRRQILDEKARGATLQAVADRHGVSVSTVKKIIREHKELQRACHEGWQVKPAAPWEKSEAARRTEAAAVKMRLYEYINKQPGKAVKEDERELARIIRCDAHELIEAIKSLESEETINVSRTLIGEVDTGYMVYYLASKKI
mgnify:CR=1 FL=1